MQNKSNNSNTHDFEFHNSVELNSKDSDEFRLPVKLIVFCLMVFVCACIGMHYFSRHIMIDNAETEVEDLLLQHKGIHHYIQRIMLPELYDCKERGEIPEDFYSPVLFSSSYMVRNMNNYINEERIKIGTEAIYYKMAAENPRNPVNKCDKKEEQILHLLNENRDIIDYREIVELNGRQYLQVAMPFLETTEACLKCHGRREDAPAQLQALYPDMGGFGDVVGNIRAIESIRVPMDDYFGVAATILIVFVFFGLILLVFVLLSMHLKRKVNSRTKALLQTTDNLHATLYSIGDAVIATDVNGFIEHMNPVAMTLTGWEVAEAKGKSLSEVFNIIDTGTRAKVTVDIESVIDDEPIESICEVSLIDRDGKECQIAFSIASIRRRGGKASGIVLVFRDVTEEYDMQKQILESEKRFRNIVSNIPGVSYRCLCDEHWTIEFVSDGIEKISGYPASDFMNNAVRSYASIIHPDDVEMVSDKVLENVNKGEPFSLEYRIIDANGSIHWLYEKGRGVFDDSGKLCCLDGVIVDVTDRKQAEEIVRNYNVQLETQVRERTEELIEKNNMLESEIKEREKAESELKNATSLMIQSERLATIGQLAASVAHEINSPLGAIGSSNGAIQSQFAELLSSLENEFMLLNNEEEQIRELIDLISQCEYVNSSRQCRETKKEITNKLREHGVEGASVVAALLSNIGLKDRYEEYIPLFKKDQSQKLLSYLQNIYSVVQGTKIIDVAVKQSSRVVNALRDFSRSDQYLELTDVDIKKTIDTAIVLYGCKVKHGISLLLDLEDVPVIRGYPHKLCQVWSNLIQNGIQAMGDKGTLSIALKRIDDNIQVSVSDTGCGMSDEVISRIFEPLFSTKPAGEGTGLGLDIVKKIVDIHGGSISVDSEIGKGSTFIITIPVTNPAS